MQSTTSCVPVAPNVSFTGSVDMSISRALELQTKNNKATVLVLFTFQHHPMPGLAATILGTNTPSLTPT